jgi:hypothetical protein
LKNTLDRAKAEMEAAAKTAQAEARSNTKAPVKREFPKPETGAVETPKPAQPVKAEPPRTASLFDAPASAPSAATVDADEDEEILGAVEEDDPIDGATGWMRRRRTIAALGLASVSALHLRHTGTRARTVAAGWQEPIKIEVQVPASSRELSWGSELDDRLVLS